jgi:HK97 family phage major capsid protein
MNLEQLRRRLAEIETERRTIHESAGTEPLTDEQQTRWDDLDTEEAETRKQVEAAEAVEARATRVRESRAKWGTTKVGTVKASPFDALNDRGARGPERARVLVEANMRALEGKDIGGADNERHVERLLKRHTSAHPEWAENLLARSHPDYATAFTKVMTGRADFMTYEERAAMAVGTATAGGLLVPTHLDPTLIITNAGTSNVIRGISHVVTLTVGNTWHGVTTAGVTASWDGELAEVSDDTPALAAATVSTVQAQSLVQASIAAMQDIDGLTADVLMLFADARDRLEGAAHATGSGSGQPKGIFTAVNASASLQVVSTTAATIGLVDLHSLYRTLPVRWRGRSTWVMNPLYSLAVKALGTALSASYSSDITQPVQDKLLGRPLLESDDAPTTQTTTALDQEIVIGDFSGYTIVDMPGGFSVEFIPHMFNTSNNLPDARRAWLAYWRNGADATNLAGFRILEDKTSA